MDIYSYLFIALIYLFPSALAKYRQHHNLFAIFLLNVLLGWTVLGWIAALVWAATAVQPKERKVSITS